MNNIEWEAARDAVRNDPLSGEARQELERLSREQANIIVSRVTNQQNIQRETKATHADSFSTSWSLPIKTQVVGQKTDRLARVLPIAGYLMCFTVQAVALHLAAAFQSWVHSTSEKVSNEQRLFNAISQLFRALLLQSCRLFVLSWRGGVQRVAQTLYTVQVVRAARREMAPSFQMQKLVGIWKAGVMRCHKRVSYAAQQCRHILTNCATKTLQLHSGWDAFISHHRVSANNPSFVL